MGVGVGAMDLDEVSLPTCESDLGIGPSQLSMPSLPSPVLSDGNSEDGNSEIEESVATHCVCKNRDCATTIGALTDVDKHRMAIKNMPAQERAEAHFRSMLLQCLDRDGEVMPKNDWTICGVKVCRYFWDYYHAMGHATGNANRSLIQQGHRTLPPPVPRMHKHATQKDAADAWWLSVYTDLAEPLANEGAIDPTKEDIEWLEVATDHPLQAIASCLEEGNVAMKRYLSPGACAILA